MQVSEAQRSSGGSARVVSSQLDVTDADAQEKAFEAHARAFSRLDAAVLCAGIGERGDFYTAADRAWQRTLAVDLQARIASVHTVSVVAT